MSFRFPHFGLCTHDGQPSVQGSREEPRGVRDPALELLEAALGDPDPAGVAVVDEHRRPARSADGCSWKGRRCPSGRTSPTAAAARSARAPPRAACRGASASRRAPRAGRLRQEPDRLGLERRRGQVERHQLDPLLRGDRLALVRRRLARSPRSRRRRARGRAAARRGSARRSWSSSPASAACTSRRGTARRPRAASSGRARATRNDSPGGGRRRLRAPSCRRATRSTRPSTEPVEASTTVNESGSAERSGIRAAGCVLAAPRRSRAASGCSSGRPALPRAPRRRGARRRARDRRLVRGGADVAGEHARARVVEDRRLDPPAEQLVGLAHEVLVERVLGRDEHGEPAAAPSCAAPLLAERGDRAREADARSPRRAGRRRCPSSSAFGRRDTEQLALGEPPLDLAPLRRRCTRRGTARGCVSSPSRSAVKRWISSAALRLFAKVSVRRPRSTKLGLELRGLGQRRAAQAELGVEQRRVPEHDRALGAWRRVVADHRHRLAEQPLRRARPGFEIVAEASRNCGSEP